ncbi:MAG: aspartate kinase, partial [Planctomycetota bacterium]
MSGICVLKFGGVALADGPAVERVCAIVARQAARAGPPPVVVVSAHRGVTDLLESVARAAAAGRSE